MYEVLAPGSVVQKVYQYTAVIQEPVKIDFTVRKRDISKFGIRDERKKRLRNYIKRRGPRSLDKTTKSKLTSHITEFTHIQKGGKMKNRKRDNASGASSTKSNISRAMQLHMPKTPGNLASQTADQVEIPVIRVDQPIILAPTTNTSRELHAPSTSEPREAL